MISYEPNNVIDNLINETSVSSIDVTLCDENMKQLDLKGMTWSMDLKISLEKPFDLENKPYSDFPVGANTDLFKEVEHFRLNPVRKTKYALRSGFGNS